MRIPKITALVGNSEGKTLTLGEAGVSRVA